MADTPEREGSPLLVFFLCLLLAAFVAEHIYLFVLNDRNPVTLPACPGPGQIPPKGKP